ncbi:SUF system Fe-S cluster assembly regulator [Lysobacter sp. TY2-98]|uniref:SUF system Fe-S cluster assembly regulator n=1 Tax=Lysobacter sp. TY2-98 TaxID=2290922 RepID=UPI000E1FFAA0|nr:SUF system Fe-S cluster assembly regulator [Lysobacter sp. TY2-98]AXK71430.1 SUF system Fe-S cluster assembly regulator [Lysobacter sp. TY2-98]
MLRVTKLTDYATVVLTVLAAARGEVLSATEIAERAGLEATTVSKVLKPLAQATLVEGFRGAHGGYRLARPARDIALIDVIEAMEGPLAVTECSVHDGQCGIESSCGIRRNWRRINDVIVQSLSGITLQDMLEPEIDTGAARRRIDLRLANV